MVCETAFAPHRSAELTPCLRRKFYRVKKIRRHRWGRDGWELLVDWENIGKKSFDASWVPHGDVTVDLIENYFAKLDLAESVGVTTDPHLMLLTGDGAGLTADDSGVRIAVVAAQQHYTQCYTPCYTPSLCNTVCRRLHTV